MSKEILKSIGCQINNNGEVKHVKMNCGETNSYIEDFHSNSILVVVPKFSELLFQFNMIVVHSLF